MGLKLNCNFAKTLTVKKTLLLLLLNLIIFSCSRNDDNEPISAENEYPLLTKLNFGFFSDNNTTNNNLYFEYDGKKRLIKKTGAFIQSSGGSGLGGFFTNQVYTSLTYTDNKVTVENFSSSPEFSIPKSSLFYVLNNKNQIEQKLIPNANVFYNNKKQTFKYIDDNVVEILTTLPDMPYFPPDDYIPTYLEKFYYNSSGNLIKSEYFEQRDGVNKGIKIVRNFGEYDTSTNPFKRLYLLDEYFYRSISKNNYRQYSEIRYNETGQVTGTSVQNWTFNYDTSGNIIIN